MRRGKRFSEAELMKIKKTLSPRPGAGEAAEKAGFDGNRPSPQSAYFQNEKERPKIVREIIDALKKWAAFVVFNFDISHWGSPLVGSGKAGSRDHRSHDQRSRIKG
jgi:hypothetical protein